jgi:NAD-dependent deacetylase
MLKMCWQEKIKELAEMVAGSNKVMVLSGAGISTESGIPDFRGPDGLWSKVDPMYVFSADTFIYRPRVFYETGLPLLNALHNARPNTAHQIIAEMEEKGLVWGVVTQNVDGLHQKAGSKNVYEAHGHLRSATCLKCGGGIAWDELVKMVSRGQLPPLCHICGGVYKPDSVFFGDPLPPDFNVCCREAADADLLLVVGSSLEVSPVNYLPHYTKRFAIINIGPTAADHRAALKVEAGAGEAFTALWEELKAGC